MLCAWSGSWADNPKKTYEAFAFFVLAFLHNDFALVAHAALAAVIL